MDEKLGTEFHRIGDTTIYLRHKLQPGDLGRIITFHGTTYAREHGLGPLFESYVAQTVGDFATRPLDPVDGNFFDASSTMNRIWLLSEEGGPELVGCCALINGGEDRAQFRWFLLDARYRGYGMGKQLLQEALDFARAGGYKEVFLYTGDFLLPAGRLYRGMGFRLVEEQAFDEWEVPNHEQKYVLIL